jgi:hypothetical protein
MLDDQSSPCHAYAVRRRLHARPPPDPSGIPPQRRRGLPAGEDADARERRIAVAGGLTLNGGTNWHFAFRRTPQPEGRCSKDRCSKLHRSEAHITGGGLPAGHHFRFGSKLRRTHGEHISSGLPRTADIQATMGAEHMSCCGRVPGRHSSLQLRKRGISKIILGGMLANMCVESHLRDLVEQGFEVAMVKDATAGPRHPVWGDGCQAAMINYQFIAHAVLSTDETADRMR